MVIPLYCLHQSKIDQGKLKSSISSINHGKNKEKFTMAKSTYTTYLIVHKKQEPIFTSKMVVFAIQILSIQNNIKLVVLQNKEITGFRVLTKIPLPQEFSLISG